MTAQAEARAPVHDMSGMEIVRGTQEGTVPGPPMADTLPFTLLPPNEGRIHLTALPEARFLNPGRTVHGGWIMTMLDTAMALAAMTTLSPGENCPSHETSAKFVRPITERSGLMHIHGSVVSRGRTVITLEGRIEDGTGRIHSHGTSTCLIVGTSA